MKKPLRRGGKTAVRNQMEGTRSLVMNGELVLYGIVDSWNDSDTIRAIDVMASLVELAAQDTIVARINSPGGSVIEGFAIYNALRASGKKIVMHVDALAASIASVIAMAGDEIVMAENASIMIHDPYSAAFGGSEDLRAAADEIDRLHGMIVGIYAARTGLEVTELESMMAAETYLSAAEAVAKGFANRVAQPLQVAACATLDSQALARLLSPPEPRSKGRIPAAPAASSHRTNKMPKPIVAGTEAAIRAERQRIQAITAAVLAAQLDATFADELIEDDLTVEEAKERIEAKLAEGGGHDTAAVRNDATRAERERASQISAAVRAAKLPTEFAEELVRNGTTLARAQGLIINRLAEQSEDEGGNVPGRSQNRVVTDAVDRWATGALAGVLARAGMEGGERNEFTGLTLAELARSSLDIRNIKSGLLDRMTMVGAAFTTFSARNASPGHHTSSDFGNILSTVAYRSLMKGYEEVEETFDLWTNEGSASDFRPVNRVGLGLFPGLNKVPEHGEYEYATISDTGVLVQVSTYGEMFAISRQAIINDDLGQFTKIPDKMGRAAKRTIGNLVYGTLTANPTMQDGVALFHASHGNLAASGSALSETSLGIARAAMSRQKDEAGIATALGVRPKYLLVPPEQLDLALKLMNAETTPGDAGRPPNAVRSMATPISDARLSGTPWYLAGDTSQVDTIEVTYLNGNKTPFLDQRGGWDVDGTEFKVRLDAGVKATHWRGLYRNPGQ